jgi:intein/homing endonuclease
MNLDYIAGFFDGEGSASVALVRHSTAVYGYKVGPRIRITQKTREILDQIQEFLAMGGIRRDRKCWNLHMERRQDCLRFVELIAPRAKIKSKQLLLLKEVLETTDDGRQGGIGVYLPKNRMLHALDLIEQIRNLNGNKRVRNDLGSVRKNVLKFDEVAHRAQADAILAKTTLNLLRKKSPEHRRKIGEAIRRFRSIPEVKAAYSERMRGNRNPQFGKPPNEKQLMGLRLGWGWNKGMTNRMQPRLAR